MSEKYADTHEWGTLRGRFATIDYADSIGGYEWDQIHILRGADGHLYVGMDGGCSCNSFGDHLTEVEDFTRVTSWQHAADLVREWFEKADSWQVDRRRTSGMDLIERLNKTRPSAYLSIDARDPWGAGS